MSALQPAAQPIGAPFFAYLRLEVRRTLRNRRFIVFTVVFPVILYVLYTAVLPQAGGGTLDGLTWPAYFLVSMAAYGAIGAAMSQATPIATERRQGWARQLRVTPLPGYAYVAAKVVSAVLLTVPALFLVSLAGRLVNGVDLPLTSWAMFVVFLALAAIPFAALGLLLGYVLDVESAQGGMVLVLFSLAILGGLFAPLASFPPLLATIGNVLPSSHFASLGRSAAAGRLPDAIDVVALTAWALVIGAVAAWRYRAGSVPVPPEPAAVDGPVSRSAPGPAPLIGPVMGGPGARRPAMRWVFIGITLFFALSPLVSLLTSPPEPVALALLLVGWAIFGVTVAILFRGSPFQQPGSSRGLAVAAAAMTAIAAIAALRYGTDQGTALYFYAGVAMARIGRERWAIGGIALVGLVAALATGVAASDWGTGITVGITVATISLTLFALSALGRSNRALQAARTELADLAVAEERSRIARDLHDTLGHSLSVIALKAELAGRLVDDDPARAVAEIGDVQQVARDALAAVRETLSGYRQPSLAIELAGARAALAAAGIEGEVEPAPDGLPRDVDAVLGWAVREGVTNVVRHSDASTARIRVLADGSLRTVEVEDDGRGPEAGAGDRSGLPGTGLDGLRERASRLGGSVEAGPLPGRGFRLRVTVPVEGVA